MGGPGSGNWWLRDKKVTVEECAVVDVRGLPKPLKIGATGKLACTWWVGYKSMLDYRITSDADRPVVHLCYKLWCLPELKEESVRLAVGLVTSQTRHGGRRWWFLCPSCCRRSGKLYRPPQAHFFLCRTCGGVTYRSAQEAHLAERLAARLGLSPEAVKVLVAGREMEFLGTRVD